MFYCVHPFSWALVYPGIYDKGAHIGSALYRKVALHQTKKKAGNGEARIHVVHVSEALHCQKGPMLNVNIVTAA